MPSGESTRCPARNSDRAVHPLPGYRARMAKRVAAAVGVLLLLGVLGVAFVLGRAHLGVRAVQTPLPDAQELAAALDRDAGPLRLHYLNTATQQMVPGANGGHPVFLLEWEDGRLFAIDAGMRREAAEEFGATLEFAMGATPIAPIGSAGDQLGEASERLGGIAFTHMHVDHTEGIASLCGPDRPLRAFQTPEQAGPGNHTTEPGRAHLEAAPCVEFETLSGGPLHEVPGYPGLIAYPGGGHTPGSTIFFARIGDRRWIFSGDVTNSREELLEDRPKLAVYSWLIVPEATGRLATLRGWLAAEDARGDTTVLVSHDLDAIVAAGVAPWTE